MRKRGWAVAGLGTLVLLLTAACGSNSTSPGSAYGSSSPMASSGASSGMYASTSPTAAAAGQSATAKEAVLTIRKTKLGNVLVNAKGDTIYYYKKDKQDSGVSACTGSCSTAWPAVAGKPAVASGVTVAGKLGTIKLSNGTLQATYNGYPLYTYAQDMAAGQTTGNGEGGVWYVITGKVLTGTGSTSTGGSSGGGYGSGY